MSVESLFKEIKEDICEYKNTAKYNELCEQAGDEVEGIFEIIITRVLVSEIRYEVWIKDKITGTQVFVDLEGLTREKLSEYIMKFAQAIYKHEYENNLRP